MNFGGLAVAAFTMALAASNALAAEGVPRPYRLEGALPEGHTGLAAKYRADSGLETDRAVVLAEGFEHGDIETLKGSGKWTSVKNPDGMAFVTDVPPGSSGKLALAMTATLEKDTGGHLFTSLLPGSDQLFARFYVKFDRDCGNIHHFVNLIADKETHPYPVGNAGDTPAGDERFSSCMDVHRESKTEWQCHLSMYTYWHHMTTHWGTHFTPEEPWRPQRDRWYCFEFMLKANSDPEAFDGELAAWVDGELLVHYGGFNWRTTNDLKLNSFWLLLYVTKEDTINPVNTVYFDDVVVARKYVGPLGRGSAK